MGATNVGSIILNYDDELETDGISPPYPFYYDRSYAGKTDGPFTQYLRAKSFERVDTSVPHFAKGVETGKFDMGSTVVLVFEAKP